MRVVVVIAAARVRETSSVLLFVFFQKKVRSIKSARFVFRIFFFFPAGIFWRKEGAGRIYPREKGGSVCSMNRDDEDDDDDDDDAIKKKQRE